MVRIQRILCPLDFFPASSLAANYAITLAAGYDAKLYLLHVVSPVVYSAEQYSLNISEIVDGLEKQAAREMKKLAGKAHRAGVAVDTGIRMGEVKKEILSAIESTKAELLVMGTHGRRGVEKWFLGSVTERILRRSPIPVLTVRGNKRPVAAPETLRRIVLTTDFSEGTEDALAYAFSLAQESQARITLLHVITNRASEGLGTAGPSLLKSIREQLEKMIPIEVRDWCDARVRVETGNPYQVILKTAVTEKADLLVMNIHGKGMVERALLGSTAERVVRGATCPVLLIPPAKAAKKRGQRTSGRAAQVL
jgi:nucleotide-binding universal stress UspA family protein